MRRSDETILKNQMVFTPEELNEFEGTKAEIISDTLHFAGHKILDCTKYVETKEGQELRLRSTEYLRKANLLAHKALLAG